MYFDALKECVYMPLNAKCFIPYLVMSCLILTVHVNSTPQYCKTLGIPTVKKLDVLR
jgi:hypothetical protein